MTEIQRYSPVIKYNQGFCPFSEFYVEFTRNDNGRVVLYDDHMAAMRAMVEKYENLMEQVKEIKGIAAGLKDVISGGVLNER